ncbi:MAG: hypothetical protein U0V48_10710 [Anaerolineales bacterium]
MTPRLIIPLRDCGKKRIFHGTDPDLRFDPDRLLVGVWMRCTPRLFSPRHSVFSPSSGFNPPSPLRSFDFWIPSLSILLVVLDLVHHIEHWRVGLVKTSSGLPSLLAL